MKFLDDKAISEIEYIFLRKKGETYALGGPNMWFDVITTFLEVRGYDIIPPELQAEEKSILASEVRDEYISILSELMTDGFPKKEDRIKAIKALRALQGRQHFD